MQFTTMAKLGLYLPITPALRCELLDGVWRLPRLVPTLQVRSSSGRRSLRLQVSIQPRSAPRDAFVVRHSKNRLWFERRGVCLPQTNARPSPVLRNKLDP
jgi:hypothetical protein